MSRERLTFLAALIAVGLSSSAVLLSHIATPPLQTDELGWIASSYYYTDLLVGRDSDWERWEGAHLENFGSMNPHLGQWMIGLPLAIEPTQTRSAFFTVYSADLSPASGIVPPLEVLLAARRTSAAYGVLCCLVVFVLGYAVGNIWIGGLSAFLLLANPLFVKIATTALTDIHYNLFLACLGAAALLLVLDRYRKRLLPAAGVCGVLTGLVCSVKILGILVGTLLFLSVLVYRRAAAGLENRRAIRCLLIFWGSALSVVYLLNPYYWPLQSRFSHLLEFPQLFRRWHWLQVRQEMLPVSSWHGNRLWTLHERLFIDLASFRFEWMFLIAGAVVCSRKIARAARMRQTSAWSVPLLCFLANYFILLALVRLNWDRYYLPAVIAGRTLAAAGIYEIVTESWRRLQPRLTWSG